MLYYLFRNLLSQTLSCFSPPRNLVSILTSYPIPTSDYHSKTGLPFHYITTANLLFGFSSRLAAFRQLLPQPLLSPLLLSSLSPLLACDIVDPVPDPCDPSADLADLEPLVLAL